MTQEDQSASPVRIVVLGAGFGGLELTSTLSDEFGDALDRASIDIVLIDRTDDFVFGFAKLDVMFGRQTADEVRHRYADIVKPGVRFVKATIESIDPTTKRVETDVGAFDADVLVVALGADLDVAATPGVEEGGHEFYTEAGAFACRDVLASFEGGRVVVGVASTPFKCPPAPSETALLVHDLLTERGLREESTITLVLPLPVPVPPSPAASDAFLAAFADRAIEFRGAVAVRALDPARKVAVLSDDSEVGYDLFLGVPVHRAPAVVLDSDLAVDGWIPVDPFTLETSFPGVYAVGDVTSVGTPKAGVFAEGQAAIVAAAIAAQVRGAVSPATYDGRGICYVEFGHGNVAAVDVKFVSGQQPTGTFDGPSAEIAADKSEFGTTRVARWFG